MIEAIAFLVAMPCLGFLVFAVMYRNERDA